MTFNHNPPKYQRIACTLKVIELFEIAFFKRIMGWLLEGLLLDLQLRHRFKDSVITRYNP